MTNDEITVVLDYLDDKIAKLEDKIDELEERIDDLEEQADNTEGMACTAYMKGLLK